jgi:5'(3')-deoxyribonucleotidase
MLVKEIISEEEKGKPIVYVDMDGVLADFFSEWAKMAGIKSGNYKDIPREDINKTLDKMIGTDFFAQLPKFSTADKLIQMVIGHFGSYKILSSPLRNDHENSKKHKIDWIGRKLKIKPEETIISSNKGAYATQADGTPNILIDDLGKNVQNWMNNGGLGIKYQADEDPLSKVQQWLSQFRKSTVAQESVIAEREENIFEKDGAIR